MEKEKTYTREEVEALMLEFAKSMVPWTEVDIPQYKKEIKEYIKNKKGIEP